MRRTTLLPILAIVLHSLAASLPGASAVAGAPSEEQLRLKLIREQRLPEERAEQKRGRRKQL